MRDSPEASGKRCTRSSCNKPRRRSTRLTCSISKPPPSATSSSNVKRRVSLRKKNFESNAFSDSQTLQDSRISKRYLKGMQDLPKDVMWDVLSRLDFKTIGCCKSVCKRWRDLVLDPDFINNVLWANNKNPSLMFHDTTFDELGTLKWIEIQDNVVEVEKEKLGKVLSFHDDGSRYSVFRSTTVEAEKEQLVDSVMMHDVDLSCPGLGQFRDSGLKVIIGQSVNGLIRVWDNYGHTWIVNPISKQYLTLPISQSRSLDLNTWSLGYGFGLLDDGTYKVINICERYSKPACKEVIFRIEVFTLGTNEWREIQPKLDIKYMNSYMGGGFSFNGCVHWISNAGQLFVFNLDNETISLFPSPPFEGEEKQDTYYGTLGVLKGCLSQGCYYYYRKFYTVWVMKEHGVKDSWYKAFTIKETGISAGERFRPLCLFDCLNFGSTLIADAGDKLVAYCLQANTRKTIKLNNSCNRTVEMKLLYTNDPDSLYLHPLIKSVSTYHPIFLNLQKFAAPNTPVQNF